MTTLTQALPSWLIPYLKKHKQVILKLRDDELIVEMPAAPWVAVSMEHLEELLKATQEPWEDGPMAMVAAQGKIVVIELEAG